MTYADSFKNAPSIEINGFGAEPQFVSNVIDHSWKNNLGICFLNNIDSKEIDNVLSFVNEGVSRTPRVVGSNSDSNEETPNGSLEGPESSDKRIASATKGSVTIK